MEDETYALTGGMNAPDKDKNTLVNEENTPVSDKNTPVEERIYEFCNIPRTITELAEYLGYKEKKSVRKHLKPLLEIGRIAMTIPEKPNSRNQKYISIK